MSNFLRYVKLIARLVNRRTKTNKFRLNDQIYAKKVRLIDKKGDQVGVVDLSEAKKIAKEKKLDLVEIAPGAKPPVVKIINYNKFIYKKEKEKSKAKKKDKSGELKEIQLSPFIGEADLNYRLKKAKEFSKENNILRVVVRFKGRQVTQQKFGYQLLEKVKEELSEFYQQSGEIKKQQRRLIMRMDPIQK